jgi:5-methyltetrahydropteroyltriglutamate--homocysteine methyltransferase
MRIASVQDIATRPASPCPDRGDRSCRQSAARAEHVGSLLRPAELHLARAQARAGALSAGELRAVEDRLIQRAVAKQEAIGLPVVTDGEFRRDFWHLDFGEPA